MTSDVHLKYRPDIDGLRALAVLAVVGFHSFPKYVWGGFVGVDIFFVISGYLISTILLKGLVGGSFSFLNFYAKRIKRIFPALVVVAFSCLAFGWLVLMPDEFVHLGKHVAGGMGFISNFLLWGETSYFDKSSDLKPLLHLWSLSIEEQFYILWPLILFAAWRVRLGVGKLVLALMLASLAHSVFNTYYHPATAFYWPSSRAWELLLGAYLASIKISEPEGMRLKGKGIELCSGLGFLFIAIALLGFDKRSLFPGWRALLPTLGTFLIIYAGPHAWLNRKLLSRPPLVFVGLISYPLYLWHWPFFSFARIVQSIEPYPKVKLTLVALSFLLAWLTYILVERPIRNSRTGKVPVALFILAILVGGIGLGVYREGGFLSNFHLSAAQKIELEVFLGRHLHAITPDGPNERDELLWTSRGYDYSRECLAKFSINGYDDKCLISHLDQEPTVALIGDSHANSLFFGFERYFKLQSRGRENLVMFGRGGCLPFWDVISEDRGIGPPSKCKELMNGLIEYVSKSKTVHTVILANRGSFYLSGGRIIGTKSERDRIDLAELYEQQLRVTVGILLAAKKRVVLAIDYPELGIDPHRCIRRPLADAPELKFCGAAKAEIDERMRKYRALMRRVLADFPALEYVSFTSVYCDSKNCVAMKNGTLLFRDTDHLSHAGSIYFGDKIHIKKAAYARDDEL